MATLILQFLPTLLKVKVEKMSLAARKVLFAGRVLAPAYKTGVRSIAITSQRRALKPDLPAGVLMNVSVAVRPCVKKHNKLPVCNFKFYLLAVALEKLNVYVFEVKYI